MTATKTTPGERHEMAKRQGATPPAWLGRSRWSLLMDVIGGWRQNRDKLVQVVSLIAAIFRPRLVRRRLQRLADLGHIDVLPTLAQLWVAARDQMILSATEETRVFYQSQKIPWVFHNLRRFISGPATMMDPVGLLSPRDTIIHHVLQTFHRHPLYDFCLLRAHEEGVEQMRVQIQSLCDGTHPHARALRSVIEDGAYHDRLVHEIEVFSTDPLAPARAVPPGLLDDPYLMLGMDQFKDLRGYTNYASRLPVGSFSALGAWVGVAFNETVGGLLGLSIGPKTVRVEACDEAIRKIHFPDPP